MKINYTLFKAKLIPVLPFLLAEAISIRKRKPKLPSISTDLIFGKNPTPILVLGESTVAGVGASTIQHTLGGQLYQILGENLSIRNLGKNGLLAKDACTLINSCEAEFAKKLSAGFIFLGANDCFHLTHPDNYRKHLENLLVKINLDTTIDWVYLADIPPVHLFPAFSSHLKKQLQTQRNYLQLEMKKIAEQNSKIIFDPIQIELSNDFFASDGVHPSDLGYQKIAQFAGEGLKKRGLIK